MNPLAHVQHFNRRHFLGRSGVGLGAMALGSLGGFAPTVQGSSVPAYVPSVAPKAKRVIYLFQSGAPAQHELLDHKPLLGKMAGVDLPDSIRMGQRLTGMTSGQASFPLVPSKFSFAKHGQCEAEISELLSHTAKVADDLCIIR
jgi:hypothetical protein